MNYKIKKKKSSELLNETYDVIIIGSGIGGLNAGCYLALEGMKVLILEKNGFIGGRCSSYKKQGYTVDYGVHAFNFGVNGPLQNPINKAKAQNLFQEDILRWERFNYEIQYKRCFLTTYLPLNISHFWNYFRTSWKLIRFKIPIKDKKDLVKLSLKIRRMPPNKIEALKTTTVQDFFNQYTKSPIVHSILGVTSDCYAVVPYDRVAAQDYVELTKSAFHNKGISYPIGGCSAIPEAYKKIIEAKGGTIIINEPVDSVIIDESKTALGVKLKRNGKELYSKYVISDVNWKAFYRSLVNREMFPSNLIENINKIESSLSGIIVHVALDKKLIKKKFVVRAPESNSLEILNRHRAGEKVNDFGCFIPIVSNIDPNLAPPGKQLICAGIGALYGGDYDKTECEDLILGYIQNIMKDKISIKDHIEWIDILRPIELEQLFGEQGSIIGLAQQIGQVRDQRLDSRTPIKGLYHCGDDSGIGLFGIGTELAALSGQNCANLILKEKSVIKE